MLTASSVAGFVDFRHGALSSVFFPHSNLSLTYILSIIRTTKDAGAQEQVLLLLLLDCLVGLAQA